MTKRKTKTPMQTIDTQCQEYSKRMLSMTEEFNAMKSEVAKVQARYLGRMRAKAEATRQAYDELFMSVEANPGLFIKPKTLTLHGVKVGYRKQKGTNEIADEGKTIELIKKHYPDQQENLIKVTETVVTKSLDVNLNGKQLKKIGVSIINDTDIATVQLMPSPVEKIVKALLSDKDQNDSKAA